MSRGVIAAREQQQRRLEATYRTPRAGQSNQATLELARRLEQHADRMKRQALSRTDPDGVTREQSNGELHVDWLDEDLLRACVTRLRRLDRAARKR